MNAKDAWLKQVKHNRKRLKGLPRVSFNPNAGDVEHNINMFNAMNNTGTLSVNPVSGPMGEALNESGFWSVPLAIANFIKSKIDMIDNEEFDDLYDIADKRMLLPSALTRTLLEAGIDPLKSMTFVPDEYAADLAIIKEITIPSNIDVIMQYAFARCVNLRKVIIEEGVVQIQAVAFGACKSLESISLPSSLQLIESHAFANCPELTDVSYDGTCEEFKKYVSIMNDINTNSNFNRIRCTDGYVKLYEI